MEYRNCFLFIILMIFSSISFAEETWQEKARREYVQKSEEVARNLQSQYPSSDFTIVNFSRAGSMAMEFLLEEGGKDYAIDRPIETFKDIERLGEAELETTLKNIFPSEQQLNGKKMVIFRPMWAGRTVSATLEILYDFFEKFYSVMPKLHFITQNGPPDNLQTWIRNGDIVDGVFRGSMQIEFDVDREFFFMFRSELRDDASTNVIHLSRYAPANIRDLSGTYTWQESATLVDFQDMIAKYRSDCVPAIINLIK